eukprot:TRINITY_DN3726_c0_g1_i1.p1 TRINITY_DN3726_c0_g1~~TRINITY_DN3726_c0_g1_i1.p1  ORF type:complete len:650 (-),score=98.82 TRINITY_DN3726_c0_g1_i1:30-1979(-)
MTDLWADFQKGAEAALDKSHILGKRLLLLSIVLLAFAVRVLGFVRLRGRFEFEDIFNLGWNENLSSGTGIISFFAAGEGANVFPGLSFLVGKLQLAFGVVGITLTAEAIYTIVGPLFASLTAFSTFLIGKHLKDDVTGLLAAGIVAVIPGFYAVSSDGRAGNVVTGTFAITLAVLFFLKAVRSGNLVHAALAGVSYFALSSLWSGYIFMLYLASAYVIVVILFEKLNSNVYYTFTIFYLVGTGLSVFLPTFGFAGFLYLEQFPGIAVFLLLQIAQNTDGANSLIMPIGGVFAIVFVATSVLGILTPSVAFFSFLRQVTSGNGSNWVSFYSDLHLVLFLFPAGIIYCFRKRSATNIFFVVYALSAVLLSSFSSHFAPILCPVAACLAALSVTSVARAYLKHQDAPVKRRTASKPVNKEIGFAVLAGVAAITVLFFVYSFSASSHPAVFRTETAVPIMSQSTNQFGWMDDFREAHSWLRHNTPADAKILSWKGLGHKLAAFARTSALGGNLERPNHLEEAANVFKLNEDSAATILEELGAEYVIVIFGGTTGFANDDLNHLNEIAPDGQFEAYESVLYKLSYNGFSEVFTSRQTGAGFDLARRQQIGFRPTLTRFEEVFTSDHWVVRIYKVTGAATAEEVPTPEVTINAAE